MLSLAEILQKNGVEYLGRYYSVYRGIVLDNVDPENQNRILVKVPSVQGGVKVWARSKSSIGGPDYGVKFLPPRPGDIVYVEFEKGGPLTALWSYHGWAKREMPEDLKPNEVFGIVTPYGHKMLVEDGPTGKLTLQFFDEGGKDSTVFQIEGSKIYIQKNGTGTKLDISNFSSMIQAIADDLLAAKSGVNLSKWMAANMIKEEE